MTVKELDVVTLPDGRTGTVVSLHPDGSYVVEVSDEAGRTLDLVDVPSSREAGNAASNLCWHQSEPSDRGVFRCTKPRGHDGPHQSAQAHWWSDPPSHERTAARDPRKSFCEGGTLTCEVCVGSCGIEEHEGSAAQEHVCGPGCTCGCAAGRTIAVRNAAKTDELREAAEA